MKEKRKKENKRKRLQRIWQQTNYVRKWMEIITKERKKEREREKN